MPTKAKKRKSGIPTGNAGEYFAMGELLKRGLDAQLADRNTKGYDMLVGSAEKPTLRKVQVKTARGNSWYVRLANFRGKSRKQVTIYVSLGRKASNRPVSLLYCQKQRRCEIRPSLSKLAKKWDAVYQGRREI